MTVGSSAKPWTSAIGEFTSDGVTVRGYDVLNDLVGKIDFGAMVYLLLSGEL
jgi:citrate synthase/citryl-CoA lyase